MIDVFLLVCVLSLSFALIIFAMYPRQAPPAHPNERICTTWYLLSTKLNAAHVYYVKRTARCRRGRSPSQASSNGLFRMKRTLSSRSFNTKSMREIQKLRAWSSFSN